jgi:hypothetical protein
MSVEGFDELQKTLGEAEHAIASLPGQIASLAVDTRYPELAIAEMERIVDGMRQSKPWLTARVEASGFVRPRRSV